MCNVRSLITNALLRLEESDDGEISEESLTTEYVFLVDLSVPWTFFSCSVGHGRSIIYFRSCRLWYPISWTALWNQKRHSQSSRNQYESFFLLHARHFLICCRSRRVFLVHVPMIRKALKVLSLTGSTHVMAFYNQPSHAMLRQTADSTTLPLVPFSAQLVWTGKYLSEFTLRFKNFSPL
jgi:hypothetical protein